ncbi:hypothetical protein D3C76_1083710 [compost metagenome]
MYTGDHRLARLQDGIELAGQGLALRGAQGWLRATQHEGVTLLGIEFDLQPLRIDVLGGQQLLDGLAVNLVHLPGVIARMGTAVELQLREHHPGLLEQGHNEQYTQPDTRTHHQLPCSTSTHYKPAP